MLFTTFYSHHWWLAVHTADIASGPSFSQALTCPWMGQHSKAAGMLPLPWLQAVHLAGTTRGCFGSLDIFWLWQFCLDPLIPFVFCRKRTGLVWCWKCNMVKTCENCIHLAKCLASFLWWKTSDIVPSRAQVRNAASWRILLVVRDHLAKDLCTDWMETRTWRFQWWTGIEANIDVYWGQTIQWVMKKQNVPIIH